MAPKNKKKNSFYFFMKEMQQKEAAKGRHISMAQMPNLAHPVWKQLSLAEREPYEDMARQHKNDPSLGGGKLASDGTRIEDNMWEEEEKRRLINKMKQDVKRYCNSDCTTEEFIDLAPKKLFYFMGFNILCCTDEEVYVPIEVGIVEYSIQHGIHREYSKIIYPGCPPTGYTGLAKRRSEETHRISVFGEECSERDLLLVYNDMKEFINPVRNEEYPPVFCIKDYIPATIGCLDWLSKRTGRENVFEVWDAAYLLMELRAGAGHPLPTYGVALGMLDQSGFFYHPSSRCAFHEEKEIHYCALTYSKRLCYSMSDALCDFFNVQLTEKHIPASAMEEKAYTVTMVKDPTEHSEIARVRLDKTQNYYQNALKEKNKVQEQDEKKSSKGSRSRQPATSCIASEMSQLQLNITAATLPGHGIGRGIRRN